MKHYQQLDSLKYFQTMMEENHRERRKAKSRKALNDFFTFIVGSFLILGTLVLFQYADTWMPIARRFLFSNGLFGI